MKAKWVGAQGKYYCEEHKTRSSTEIETNEECYTCAKKQQELMLRYRGTICLGCHYNRYNFKSEGDAHNAPTIGEGCWHLTSIIRARRCPFWHRG